MRYKQLLILFILLHVVELYPGHRFLSHDYIKTDFKLTQPTYLSYAQHNNYHIHPNSLAHSTYRPGMLGTMHHLQAPQLDAHIVANDLTRSFYAQWLVQTDPSAGIIKNGINVALSSIEHTLKVGTTFERFQAVNQLQELVASFDAYCKDLQYCANNNVSHSDSIDINMYAAQCAREELYNVLNNIKAELFDKKTGAFLDRAFSKEARKQIEDYKQYKNIVSAPDKDKLQRIENNRLNQALNKLLVCFQRGDLSSVDKIMSQFASDRKLSKVLRNFKNSSPYFNEFGVPKVWEAHPKWNIYKQDFKAHSAQRDILISILQHDHNNAQGLCERAGIVAPGIAQLCQAYRLQDYQNDPDFMAIASKSLQRPDTFEQTIHMLEQRAKALECIHTIAQQNLSSLPILQQHMADLVLFARDPIFVSTITDIVHNPETIVLLKKELFQREIYVQTLADKLGDRGFSHCAEQISYQLADAQSDLQRIEILSPLCIDHAQEEVRSAYHTFYDETTHLPRIFNYDQQLLEIILPESIATQQFTQERALYTQIMVRPITCNEQHTQAQQCISFLCEACKTKEQAYRDLACTVAKTYLQPKNYIPENCTEQTQLFEQAHVAVQQDLYAHNKLSNNHEQRNITTQVEVNYHQLHDHAAKQCTTLQNNIGHVPDYYRSREQALKDIMQGNGNIYTKTYVLSSQATKVLEKYDIDPVQFTHCTGNAVQQDTNAKLVNTLNTLTQKTASTHSLQQIKDGVIECAQASSHLNQKGNLQEAMLLSDMCHVAVEYLWHGIDTTIAVGKGVAEGVYLGVSSEITDMLRDPHARPEAYLRAGGLTESNLAERVTMETATVVSELLGLIRDSAEVLASGAAGVGDAVLGLPDLARDCVAVTKLTGQCVGHIAYEMAELAYYAECMDQPNFNQQLHKMQQECGQVAQGISSYLKELTAYKKTHNGIISKEELKECVRSGGRFISEGIITSKILKGTTKIMKGAAQYVRSTESALGQIQHIKELSGSQMRNILLSAQLNAASFEAEIASRGLIEQVATHAQVPSRIVAPSAVQALKEAVAPVIIKQETAAVSSLAQRMGQLVAIESQQTVVMPYIAEMSSYLNRDKAKIDISKLNLDNLPIHLYDSTMGDLNKLQNFTQQFKNIPGALDNDGPLQRVLELGYTGSSDARLKTTQGALYELEVASHLELKGEKVLAFNIKYEGKYSTREFDIITQNKLVECKNIDWANMIGQKAGDFKGKIVVQSGVAHEFNKEFVLFSKQQIPTDWKAWFAEKNIKTVIGS